MPRLKNSEIDYIIESYKKISSIEKTAKITGFSRVTVNKYVVELSSKDIRSKNCPNPVLQLDINNNIIREWAKPSLASKNLNINLNTICRALKGDLNNAGGYRWKYKNKI